MTTENTVSKTETLFGGTELVVSLKDGTSEIVKVIQLPVSKFIDFAKVIDDECEMVSLVCNKKKEWCDSLQIEAFELLVAECERINMDFFGRWLQRRINRQQRILPGTLPQSVLRTGAQK